MSEYFDLLYAQPSLLNGAGSAFDLTGSLQQYNESLSARQADYLTILSDLRTLKRDLEIARSKGVAKSVQQDDE